MFEYVTLTVDWDHLQDVLNAQGSRGWHVVHIDAHPISRQFGVVLERQTARVGIPSFDHHPISAS